MKSNCPNCNQVAHTNPGKVECIACGTIYFAQLQETKKKDVNPWTFLGWIFLLSMGGCVTMCTLGQIGVEKEKADRNVKERSIRVEVKQKPALQAADITRTYEENEVNADDIFKNKVFKVEGIVNGVDKGLMGEMYVTLEGHKTFDRMRCNFEEDNTHQLLSLRKGDTVRIVGVGSGLMISVQMDRCEVVK